MNQILIMFLIAVVSIIISAISTRFLLTQKLSLRDGISKQIVDREQELLELKEELLKARNTYSSLFKETKHLRELEENHLQIKSDLESSRTELLRLNEDCIKAANEFEQTKINITNIARKADLYSRLDEQIKVGHFQLPEYIYETSDRFKEEIKLIRERQKKMVSDSAALKLDGKSLEYLDQKTYQEIIFSQSKLMLNTFNIECDLIIGKVNHSNYSRTLEQIENKANSIEKLSSELFLGFNIEYVKLKMEECTLQYQFKLKQRDEQEEQRLIREQLREEKKAVREYEAAIRKAEAEEKLYQEMLEKARIELSFATDSERFAAETKIAELEMKLAEAESLEQRARSMAEQTRKGFVYVISNIGSFGEGIYKIGLTRRLEPMDRVKELGDASVPFTFDVHALIAADDAPALEAQLHREFSEHRVNVVNNRKEFFKVELDRVEHAVRKITGKEYEFNSAAEATDYYESLKFA